MAYALPPAIGGSKLDKVFVELWGESVRRGGLAGAVYTDAEDL